jgi:hypothetical protein
LHDLWERLAKQIDDCLLPDRRTATGIAKPCARNDVDTYWSGVGWWLAVQELLDAGKRCVDFVARETVD